MISLQVPSELFPFTIDQLDQLAFEQYLLTNVFEKITVEQRDACVELWLRNRVLPSEEAAIKRSQQICYHLTNRDSGKTIGVNTLYRGFVTNEMPEVWLNRMFIDPLYRNTRLMIVGTSMMLCFAKLHLSDRGLPGVVNINENRKLSRPGAQRVFHRLGYRRIGWQNNNEVIMFRFNDIELNAG
ncbi:MAG: hypothetical protein AAF197_12280 [Pseudomonadota bacterium]